MKNENKYVAVISASFTVLFAVCLISTILLLKKAYTNNGMEQNEKEYVYVELIKEVTEKADENKPLTEKVWIVKEYYEQIGIFNENGELVKLLEIYTKTLPEADRRLLREGIRITSIDALDALIEDYTS